MDNIISTGCDTIVAKMNENAAANLTSIECANTNFCDVMIAGIICTTILLIAVIGMALFYKLRKRILEFNNEESKRKHDVEEEERKRKHRIDDEIRERSRLSEYEKKLLDFFEKMTSTDNKMKEYGSEENNEYIRRLEKYIKELGNEGTNKR